jgi:hypothetical protein
MLLGQSALEQLGSFTFDYESNLISFQKSSQRDSECKTGVDCSKKLKCRNKKGAGNEC